MQTLNTQTIEMHPWQSVAPAANGWYVASFERNADFRRYWDGAMWSAPCYSSDPQGHFDRARATVGETQHGIESPLAPHGQRRLGVATTDKDGVLVQ